MTIEKKLTGNELTITLTGRMDTTTAPQLESELKASLDGVEKLVLDFAALDYLSSAGLPLCQSLHKQLLGRIIRTKKRRNGMQCNACIIKWFHFKSRLGKYRRKF